VKKKISNSEEEIKKQIPTTILRAAEHIDQ